MVSTTAWLARKQRMDLLLLSLALLLFVNRTCLVSAGRYHMPSLGRFNLQTATPQDPAAYSTMQHGSTLSASAPSTEVLLSDLLRSSSSVSTAAVDSRQIAPARSNSQFSRHLLQQADNSTADSSTGSASSSSNGSGSGNSSTEEGTITLCPAWAPAAATVAATTANPYASSSNSANTTVSFTADFNEDSSAGITAADREGLLSAVAGRAFRSAAEAAGNSSRGSNSSTDNHPVLGFEPGLFEALNVDEILSVFTFLFNQTALNLTPIETATNNDNYITVVELKPPIKSEAVAWLDDQARVMAAAAAAGGQQVEAKVPKPVRAATAMLIEGRHDPPRVTQIMVWPLPTPTNWSYVPLGPAGQMEAGWLQRPYSMPEATSVAEVVNRNVPKLNPLLNQTLDGWMYDPNGTTCAPRCLTFSLGAPFGASAAAAAGSKVDQGSEGAQRWLWAYYYRNMEGHHLHTVGLEVQLDVAAYNPKEWTTGKVWFADTLWPSIDDLMATWNSSRTNGSIPSSITSDMEDQLKGFKVLTPNATDALFSTFIPRTAPGKPLNRAKNPATGADAEVSAGPPIQYEPGGRRFRLAGPTGNAGLDDWMGWSFSLGHKPTTGVSFWDIRFKGERIIYELSLQEAYAGYGGPSPMQSHVQYLDSHWGLGAAYKELVAGLDCPLNAAYIDLIYSFNSGPLRQRNGVCVFELATGMPLLRHWADTGGGPIYYGALPASVLVVRAISAVYNYDYVQDLKLHLDGSIEVGVHTTGYVQSSRYNAQKDGNQYAYPFWYDNSGTIHDHLLNWKVDIDVAGGNNSVRMDQVVLQQRDKQEAFSSPYNWFTKHIVQKFPATESEAALFANGSSKAAPNKEAHPMLFYVVNENDINRWGSARGYRLQHTLKADQVVPTPDEFGNSAGIGWSHYKVAVTARREWEPSSSSVINQALPFAPAVDFRQLLSTSDTQNNVTKAQHDNNNDPGDNIRGEDLVLWVTSGLQHLPGSEDAPVTPTSGPAIGFWLRPFNFFDESAAASQPGMVYIPALTEAAAKLAVAVADGNAATHNRSANSTAGTGGVGRAGGGANGPNALPQIGVGSDTPVVVGLYDPAALEAARRGIQPYVGVPYSKQCLPNWGNVPFNGTYAPFASAPVNTTAVAATSPAGGNRTSSSLAGSSSSGSSSSNGTTASPAPPPAAEGAAGRASSTNVDNQTYSAQLG